MRRWAGILVAAAAACGGGQSARTAAPAAAGSTSLWELAPAPARFGFVVSGGGSRLLIDGAAEWLRVLGDHPVGAEIVAEVRANTDIGIDPFDGSGWDKAGLDRAGGAAVFIDESFDAGLLVLPVRDRRAFRAAAGLTTERIGGREVDRLGKLLCAEAAGRYLCATDLAVIDAAVAPHDSPLARRVAALPPELRGEIELVAEVAGLESARGLRDSSRPLLDDLGAMVMVASLEPGAARLRFWFAGRPTELGRALAAAAGAAAPADLADANTASALRLRLPMPQLLGRGGGPPSVPIPGGFDLRPDLIDQLTGEVALYAAGRSLAAGRLVLGVADAGRVGAAMRGLCAAAKAEGIGAIAIGQVSESGCGFEVQLAAFLPEEIMSTLDLPPDVTRLRGSVAVSGGRLIVTVGEPAPAGGLLADAAGSAGGRELLTGGWLVAGWTRALEPLAALDDATYALVHDRLARAGVHDIPEVGFVRWLFSHVYEAGFGFDMRDDGMHALVQVTTFAADPPELYRAYQAAVKKLLAGDRAGYRADLAALAARAPGSLVAHHAALVDRGAPLFTGAIALLVAIAMS